LGLNENDDDRFRSQSSKDISNNNVKKFLNYRNSKKQQLVDSGRNIIDSNKTDYESNKDNWKFDK